MTAYNLLEQKDSASEPSWKDIVFDFKLLSAQDIQQLGLPARFTHGFKFATLVIEQRLYLNWLMSELKKRGVVFIK